MVTAMLTGYDSDVWQELPGGGDFYLAYVDGYAANYLQVKAAHPNARIVTITTTGRFPADVCDVEYGDVSAQGGVNGLGTMWDVLYSNISTKNGQIDPLMKGKPYNWYAADPTGHPHLVNGSVATQWAWPTVGSPGHYDISWALESWLTPAPVPPSPNPTPALQEALDMIPPPNCTDRNVFGACLRTYWLFVRTDPLTQQISDLSWMCWNLPPNKNGFGGNPDAWCANIINEAVTAGTLRPNLV